MKKLKLLVTAGALLCAGQGWAQTDVTSQVLLNPSFELADADTQLNGNIKASNETALSIYGWTQNLNGITNYNNTEIINNETKGSNSNHSAAIAAADGSYHLFFRRSWNDSNTKDISFTSNTSNYSPGAYTVTFSYILEEGTSSGHTSTGSYLTIKVLDTSGVIASTKINAKNWGGTTTYTNDWATATVTFSITEQKNLSLAAVLTPRGGNKTELHLDNFVVQYASFATSDDYTALNTAIETVESKTLGFDAGEYAPYNHVNILKALAEAKAIDQNENNSQITVQNLTATLNTTMTPNAEEVNAIWDPSFEHEYSTSGDVQPIAWTGTSGHNNATDVRWMWNVSSNAGLNATSSTKALFTKYGVFYGQEQGYAMPLNADTYYTISFEYGGWGDCKKDGYVTMIDPESTSLTLMPSSDLPLDAVDGSSNKDSWKHYSACFKTNAAGNYVLGLRKKDESKQSQYVYGDFVLKTMTVAEAAAYYTTVLDEVSASYDAEANGATEKTAFNEAINADISGMTVNEIMDAAANLYTLRDAFVAATPYYDRYVAEKANAERINTAITSDIAAPTTQAEADATLKTILVNEYNYVKENFNADAAQTYGITIDKWTGTATSGGSSDTPQTKSEKKWGTGATTYYEQGKNGWGSSSWTLNYTKTVTLPANTYVLKVAARASGGATATLKATIGSETFTEALPSVGATGKGITTSGVASFDEGEFAGDGVGYGWQWRYLAFTLEEESEVTLQIDASASSVNQWCSFGDVAVVSNVTTEALETAYNNFTMQTLGFEKDQYAPYNNAEILQAYAEAKAIVEGTKEPSTQADVDALTVILTSPSWTQNATDVDAICNGNFAEKGTGNNPKAWTRDNNAWGQQITDLTPETNKVNEGTTTAWYYNTNGAWQYGNDGVYTMPLAGNTAYKLTFKYRSHAANSNNWMKASVQNAEEEGLTAVQFEANKNATEFITATATFTTGAAGNYILSLEQNGNTHLTDVSLVKVAAAEQSLAETTGFAMTEKYAYTNVALTRTFSAGVWNTFVVPFDIDNETLKSVFGNDVQVAEATLSASAVSFNTMETPAITANKPVIIKGVSTAAPYSFEGVMQKNASATITNEGTSFIGTYEASKTLNAGEYYIAQNQLKVANGTQTIKGFRAYLTTSTGARLTMFVDNEETTAIDGIEGNGSLTKANVYNLNGIKMDNAMKLPKGVYVIDGKKVVVK